MTPDNCGFHRLLLNLVAGLGLFAYLSDVPVTAQVQRQDVVAMYLFNGQNENTYRSRLEHQSELRVERLSQIVRLSEPQLEKLKWAVQGDLNRFYRDMSLIREQTKDLNLQDQADMQKAWQLVMPLQQRASRGIVTSEDSLLEKVLSSTLSQEQQVQYKAYLQERQLAEFKAILRMTIADMEKTLPLTAQQRTQLIKLVESKDFPRKVDSQYAPFVGFIMLGRLSRLEVQEILDEHQQAVFQQLKEQYKAYENGVTW